MDFCVSRSERLALVHQHATPARSSAAMGKINQPRGPIPSYIRANPHFSANSCMPAGAVCCTTGYCDAGETCLTNGKCGTGGSGGGGGGSGGCDTGKVECGGG